MENKKINPVEKSSGGKKTNRNKKILTGVAAALLLGCTASTCLLLGKTYLAEPVASQELVDSLIQRIEEMQNKIESQGAEIEKNKKEIADLLEKVGILKNSIEELETNLAITKAELEAAIEAGDEATIAELTKLKEEQEAKIAELKKNLDDFKASQEQAIKELKETLAKIDNDIKSLEEMDAALNKKIAELTENLAKFAESQAELFADVFSQIEELKALCQKIEVNIEDLEERKQEIITLLEEPIEIKNQTSTTKIDLSDKKYKDKYINIYSELLPTGTSTDLKAELIFPKSSNADLSISTVVGALDKRNNMKLSINATNVTSISVNYAYNPDVAPPPIDFTDKTITFHEGFSYNTTFEFINGTLTINVNSFSHISTVAPASSISNGEIYFYGSTNPISAVKGFTVRGTLVPFEHFEYMPKTIRVTDGEGGPEVVRTDAIKVDLENRTFEFEVPQFNDYPRNLFVHAYFEQIYDVAVEETVEGGKIELTAKSPLRSHDNFNLNLIPNDGKICSELNYSIGGSSQGALPYNFYVPGAILVTNRVSNIPNYESIEPGKVIKFTPTFIDAIPFNFEEFNTKQYVSNLQWYRTDRKSPISREPIGGLIPGENVEFYFNCRPDFFAPDTKEAFATYVSIKDQNGNAIDITDYSSNVSNGEFAFTVPSAGVESVTINFTLPPKA